MPRRDSAASSPAVAETAKSSRRLQEPLAAVIRSQAAAGKPSLMDTLLSLVSEGDPLKLSDLVGKEG